MAKKQNKRGQGEGCITRRKDGSWAAVITVGKNPDGSQKRRFFYGKTRQEVSEKMNKALNDISTGLYVDPSKITVADWLDTWLWNYKSHSIKPKTLESYSGLIENHLKKILGTYYLQELKTNHVQNMITTLKKQNLSARTIKYCHTVLHAALKQAYKINLIVKNVCEYTILPKQEKKEIKVLSVEEQQIFINTAKDHRLYPAFMLLLSTGVRLGELLALHWDCVNLEEGSIKITQNIQRIKTFDDQSPTKSKLVIGTPKTEKGRRVIPLLEDITTLLKIHFDNQLKEKEIAREIYTNQNLVFCTEIGGIIDPHNFTRAFKRLLIKANLPPINIHACRHTFATRGLEQGIELKVMQELLGHASISLTGDIYSHVLPNKKKDSILKLKDVFKPVISSEDNRE